MRIGKLVTNLLLLWFLISTNQKIVPMVSMSIHVSHDYFLRTYLSYFPNITWANNKLYNVYPRANIYNGNDNFHQMFHKFFANGYVALMWKQELQYTIYSCIS